MIGVLRWDGVGFPFDVRGNVLISGSVLVFEIVATHPTFLAMNTDNGPANVKMPVGFTEVTMAST